MKYAGKKEKATLQVTFTSRVCIFYLAIESYCIILY